MAVWNVVFGSVLLWRSRASDVDGPIGLPLGIASNFSAVDTGLVVIVSGVLTLIVISVVLRIHRE